MEAYWKSALPRTEKKGKEEEIQGETPESCRSTSKKVVQKKGCVQKLEEERREGELSI